MPYKCCVPNCKTNYRNGPQRSVFSFPKEVESQKKWLSAIFRSDFTPSKCSRVCELHFREDDIERAVSMYDEKNRKQVSAPLSVPRLKPGSVPSQMPGCPNDISLSSSSPRESPRKRRRRLANEALQKAIEDSMKTLEADKGINNFDDLKMKLENVTMCSDWVVLKKDTSIVIALLKCAPTPELQCCVCINEELQLTAYAGDTEIKSIKSTSLPRTLIDVGELENILDEMQKKFSTSESGCRPAKSVENILHSLEQLEELLNDDKSCIKFLKEQVSLLTVPKTSARYSSDTMQFCRSLYSISSHAYKFLRSSNFIKMPSLTTVKQGHKSVSPQLQQNASEDASLISFKLINNFHKI